MTDRHSGYVIALDRDMREDDAAHILNAIRMIKGVLSVQPVPVEFPPYVVRESLTACLAGDDDHAARLLAGLTSVQLYAIEGAASGLAIHASTHRKRLDPYGEHLGASCTGTAVDETPDRITVDEYERRLTADEQPEEARVLSRAELAAELRAVEIDRDQWRDRARHWKAATVSATAEAVHRAERAEVRAAAILLRAKAAERRADEQKARAQRAERQRSEAVKARGEAEAAVERAREMVAHEIRTGNGASAHTLRRILDALNLPKETL